MLLFIGLSALIGTVYSEVIGYRVILTPVPYAKASRVCEKKGDELAALRPRMVPDIVRTLKKAKVGTVWMSDIGNEGDYPAGLGQIGGQDFRYTFIEKGSKRLKARHAVMCAVMVSQSDPTETLSETPSPGPSGQSSSSVSSSKSFKTSSTSTTPKPIKKKPQLRKQVPRKNNQKKVESRNKKLSSSSPSNGNLIVHPSKNPHFRVRVNGMEVDAEDTSIKKIIDNLRSVPLQQHQAHLLKGRRPNSKKRNQKN